ncbi:hypothetical protein MSAN_01902600 [Mycena sanguinolenta]|uniref:DUF6534 domain-containing protein n=1 Tax=Mycena sanguinolenta TaxID=230812 RepID=A0A8H6XRR4_9AGAR|nr:hypothetical protein MSAN_01902600 [Mycena sanguinolenta]
MTSSQLSPRERMYILCGWDIAICSSLFLQGVLCTQFDHYINMRKCDSMKLKFYVGGLALMTTLNAVQSLAIMWIQNVTLFGNLDAASKLWETNWVTKLTIPLEGIIAFYVQMFYCYRLWILCRKPYIVITCAVVFTFGLVASFLATFFILTNDFPSISWMTMHLGVVLGGDFFLTGNMLFWLLRSKESTLSRGPTATILNLLFRLTSAGPCAICALVTFIASMRVDFFAPVPMMIEFITITILPQLYAWSAMWTLNSREDISLAAEDSPYTVDLVETSGAADGSSDAGTLRILHVHETIAVDNRDQEIIHPVAKVETSDSNCWVI